MIRSISIIGFILYLCPVFATAQISRGLKAGESLVIENGTAIVVHSAFQSGVRIGSNNYTPFKCRIVINQIEVPVQIYPDDLERAKSPSIVLSGPAVVNVDQDSAITFSILQSLNFVSMVATNRIPRSIECPSGKVVRFYAPLLSTGIDLDGYYSRGTYRAVMELDSESKIAVIDDFQLGPQVGLAGRCRVAIQGPDVRPDGFWGSDPFRYLITVELSEGQAAPIVPSSLKGGIKVESSNDMMNWNTILSTNQFIGGKGFYRLRN